MKKTILLFFAFCCAVIQMFAQQYVVRGKVVNNKSQVVEFASAVLLRADSSAVSGVMTNEKGQFDIKVKSPGDYLLKISFIGFDPCFKAVRLSDSLPVCDAGILKLSHGTTMLGTATVTATAAKVEQVEDTTMFNASAYRVPEGSTLEALVKQLPGVEIEDDGTITWNGKQIKEFLVNGKDFFKGQADVALQNLPSDWVSRIKAYEKKSDYAEQTGIDDGEDFPVLDIVTKRELNQTVIARTDFSYGTDDRYFEKLFVTRFTDHSRVSAYGSMNNVNDKSFGGKRKRQGGGLISRKNAGTDFFWNNKKGKREGGRIEVGGNINFNHTDNEGISKTESEHFLSSGTTSSFRSAVNQNHSSNTSFDTHFRLDWNPDTMTMIQFRPSFNHSEGRNSGESLAATFNDDPFSLEEMVSPLDSLFADLHSPLLDSMAVNRNHRLSRGNRENNAVNASLNIVRRLNTKGRNVSLNVSGGYNRGENNNFSISEVTYYNGRGGKYLNQYSNVPSTRWNYRVQLGYVEPIVKNWFADFRYAFNSRYNDSERSRYNLDRLGSDVGLWGDSINYPEIGTLPDYDVMQQVRDSINSQYATYRFYDHSFNLNVRYNTKDVRFIAGVNVNPERTKMSYERPGQHLDTVIVRKICKITPQLNFRYFFSHRNSLEFRYIGQSSEPSMTDLLAVVDNSHPLNVTMGNPGLEPSWNNRFDLGYRGYRTEHQQGFALGFNYTQTKNAVSQLSVYDESTGVRYHRPQNINGNWNMRTNFMFNTGLGANNNLTLSTNTNLLFNNAVGYISSFNSGPANKDDVFTPSSDYSYYDKIFEDANIQKNTTKTLGLREYLKMGYRKSWFEIAGFSSFNYNHSRASKRHKNDRDTWNYSYGLNTNLDFDWGLSLSTDIRVNSRRGYPNASMNTDEWLWNAQIAYSFLKKKSATISLQMFDILKQQSNVSHTISATQCSDSWNNDIHSYGMIHFIYKFRYIGGKKNKSKHHNARNRYEEDRNKSIIDEVEEMQQNM